MEIPIENLKIEDLSRFLSLKEELKISSEGRKRVLASHKALKRLLASGQLVYGVNTGFGALVKETIPLNKAKRLQYNLIISHAVGDGKFLPKEVVKLAIFLRANMLAKGYSGVRIVLIERLLELLNCDIIPVVYEKGSVGASGDLAPLAQIALTLLGKGQVYYQDRIVPTELAFKKEKIKPIELAPKEGLALINGTEVMSAALADILFQTDKLFLFANQVSALSGIAAHCNKHAFAEELNKLKPYPHQLKAAQIISELLQKEDYKEEVQDPYSIRCTPQVQGAVGEGIDFAKKILETEINSITDNPLIINNKILAGGNFHGQGLALAGDVLAISLTTLALLSERRIFYLTSGKNNKLPIFLIKNPGINSGLMMAQTLAAALAGENKSLSYPASVTSLPTSANQEDFVSMGMSAILKAKKILENTKTILAIELLCATQGIELAGIKLKGKAAKLLKKVRQFVPFIKDDVELGKMIMELKNRINEFYDDLS